MLIVTLLAAAGLGHAALAQDAVDSCACHAAAADCCREITRECLTLELRAHCPPAHRCVTPLIPADCRTPLTLCHKPIAACVPCGEPRPRCECHKPVVGTDLEICGELEITRTGSRDLVIEPCPEDCGCAACSAH